MEENAIHTVEGKTKYTYEKSRTQTAQLVGEALVKLLKKNGLIGQFFPKGRDFRMLCDDEIKHARYAVVFDDYAINLSFQDSDDEERFIVLGLSAMLKTIVVCLLLLSR